MKKETTLIEDRKQNINLFKDINDLENYSKYSNKLNKVFSYHSYSKFLKDLSQKNKKVNTFKDQMNEWINLSNPSKITKRMGKFDIEKFKSDLKKMEIKEILLHQIKKEYYDKRTYKRKLLFNSTKNRILDLKNKKKNFQAPDIGKYNPKYDVIDTHTYQVVFGKQNFYEFNSPNKSNSNDKYGNLNNTKSSANINPKICYRNNSNDKRFKTEESETINNISDRTKTQVKFNHKNKIQNNNSNISIKSKKLKSYKTTPNQLFRNNNKREEMNKQFLTYKNKLNKKRIMNEFNKEEILLYPKIQNMKRNNNKSKNNTSILNSISYSKYSNKKETNTIYNNTHYNNRANLTLRDHSSTINSKRKLYFNRIVNTKIGYFEEMAKKNDNPKVGQYEPNYSTIYARTTNVFLPIRNKNKNLKKKILKKIFSNYHKTTDYELFDTLNDNSNNSNNSNNNLNLLTMGNYNNLY